MPVISSGSHDLPSPDAAATPRRTFGREVRLHQSARIRKVFDNGRCVRGAFVVLWLLPGEAGRWRLCVVASRRTFRRAVDRNRAKRLVREAFRLARHAFPGACDLVCVARRAILNVGEDRVEQELRRLAGVPAADAPKRT